MILRRRKTPEDLKHLWMATKTLELRKWHPERTWSERIRANKLLPILQNEEIEIQYTHAPMSGRIPFLRRNAIKEYFEMFPNMIESSLDRLRNLKLPHLTHIDAGWELRAIRSSLRRRSIDPITRAKMIVRLAGSGLAKYELGDVRRVPYEVIMAHFTTPDAAAYYDTFEKKIYFPSPSAVRVMLDGRYAQIHDLVNTMAHEAAHHKLNTEFYLLGRGDIQVKYDSLQEGIASAFGDLAAHILAQGPKPKERFADHYLKISLTPMDGKLFKAAYLETAERAKHIDDLPNILEDLAKRLGISIDRKP